MTFKVSEVLLRRVEDEARRRGVPKSVMVRECVETVLRRQLRQNPPSCLDLVADLVGSQPGPRDVSVGRHHLSQALLADHGRARKTPASCLF
jgi:hypothetical protein